MIQPTTTIIRLVKARGYKLVNCTCGREASHTLQIGNVHRGYTHSLCLTCLRELLKVLDIDKDINP